MNIVENRCNIQLLDFFTENDEDKLNNGKYGALTHALAIIKYESKTLLAFNIWRKQWELPTGCIEQGEN